jgi:hypothetical protein
MALNVPESMNIIRADILLTRYFDLLETPLRQYGVISAKVTSKYMVTQPHPRGQRLNGVNLIFAALLDIVYNLNAPIIMDIADGLVAIARHFIVEF